MKCVLYKEAGEDGGIGGGDVCCDIGGWGGVGGGGVGVFFFFQAEDGIRDRDG